MTPYQLSKIGDPFSLDELLTLAKAGNTLAREAAKQKLLDAEKAAELSCVKSVLSKQQYRDFLTLIIIGWSKLNLIPKIDIKDERQQAAELSELICEEQKRHE